MFSNVASTGAGVLFAMTFFFPQMAMPAATPSAISNHIFLPFPLSYAHRLNEQCQKLVAAGLSSQIYYPGDAKYAARETSFWPASAPLPPQCIVQPRNTSEVSKAIKAITSAGGDFAVRSGGHGHWAGASDVRNGPTIDLGLMNATIYNSMTKVASIQPGPRWSDVYAQLDAKGAVVAGGRDGNVGIGGFLTGGGNSYYTGQLGLACDSVVNVEVVLADGSVVNANKNTNTDLWRALKGGSGNFGIVTRFDLKAIPSGPLWGGLRASPRSSADQAITVLIKITNNNHKNPQDAYIFNFTYSPSMFTEVIIANILVDTKGVVNAPAFNEIQQVPAILEDVKVRTMHDMATSYFLPSGSRNVWFTLTVKNDARIVKKSAELYDQLVADLINLISAGEFTTQCLFQPMPTYIAKKFVAEGGNVIGINTVKDNALLWLGTAAVNTVAHEAIVQQKMSEFSAAIEAYAKTVNGNVGWRYLNYADPSHNPLESYGATNVAFIKKVAEKYDPNKGFQRAMGGFKISRA